MSLINNMLRGLEQRRREHGEYEIDPVLDELSAVDYEELQSRRRSSGPGLWAVVFLLLIVLFVTIITIATDSTSEGLLPTTVSRDPATGREVPSANSPDSDAAAETVPAPAVGETTLSGVSLKLDGRMDGSIAKAVGGARPGAPVPLRDVRMNREGEELRMDLVLPGKTRYLIYTLKDPDRVVLELDNVRYDGILPDISRLDGIRSVRQRRAEDGTYKLVLESDREIRIERSDMNRMDEGYVLQVAMAFAAEAESESKNLPELAVDLPVPQTENTGTFSKSPVSEGEAKDRDAIKQTASETDVLVYEGRKLYREGDIRDGLDRIIEAVERQPDHTGARKTLAILLLEQGRRAQAKELLVRGLRLNPGQAEWAVVLARILYDEGNLDRARAVLEGAAPPLRTHLDYHALYAGVLQGLEDHARAAIVYRNLLQYGGSNGSWWLGLAISLEAMARDSDAAVAYRNALNAPEITADSRRFIKDRLRGLEQRS